MDVNRKGSLYYIRYTLTVIGALVLVAALFMLALLTKTETDTGPVLEPTRVNHRVLFLCSYNPLYFTYEDQENGLKEALYPNGIEFDVIYMDTKNYGNEEDIDDFHDFLKERLKKDRGYEAVLLGDDDALIFALKYQDELFKDYPMVFFGINDAKLAVEAAKNPMITGFYEKDYIKDCMDLAMTTLPDRKYFVALHDNSAAGAADLDIFYSYDSKYPDYVFTSINTAELSEEELIEALKNLPKDAVLFYMTCYSDKEGRTYSMLDRTNTVVSYARVPVFRNYSGGRDQGVLGGTYMDFQAQCRDAALVIYDVLENRTDIESCNLDVDTPSKTSFNYKMMQKYNIDEALLPAGTEFIDKPISIVEYYRSIIPIAIMIVAALMLFIIASNIAVEQQKIANQQIKESRDSLEESQKKLIYQAEHDELLDLLNRKSIVSTLNMRLSPSDIYSILMVDIDGFKSINENFGHAIADDVLKYIASKLKEMERKYKWLTGRYSGDEFIIMIPEKTLDEKSAEIIEILGSLRKTLTIEQEVIQLSASVGIANSDGVSGPEQNIINAEIAMYEAKERGKDTAFVYTDSMQQNMKEENRIKALVLEAFDKNLFYMVYHPKIDAKTKKPVGFEALVRMKNLEKSPSIFVPIIEKNGWISKLGRVTTRIVIEQLAEWKSQGKELLPVSINYSSRQVNDARYVQFLNDLLQKHDIDPEYVQLEMTESMFLEKNNQTMRLFERFKKMGIKILLDDFGTGYSSLGYLTYIPIDEIKLDKSLVDAYLIEGKDLFIRDVIQLVHDLNKTIIIEGVEQQWQYERLLKFGADTIQGFYFSRPVIPEKATDFLPLSEENEDVVNR